MEPAAPKLRSINGMSGRVSWTKAGQDGRVMLSRDSAKCQRQTAAPRAMPKAHLLETLCPSTCIRTIQRDVIMSAFS